MKLPDEVVSQLPARSLKQGGVSEGLLDRLWATGGDTGTYFLVPVAHFSLVAFWSVTTKLACFFYVFPCSRYL